MKESVSQISIATAISTNTNDFQNINIKESFFRSACQLFHFKTISLSEKDQHASEDTKIGNIELRILMSYPSFDIK